MASKRKHSDMRDDVHVSRQPNVTSANFKPSKSRRMNGSQHTTSVNAIKTRIRDITRRLERLEDLPADVRAEDERALAAYQQELAAAEDEKVRQKMIKRYHMVRFFERQKATRSIKKVRKQLIEATEPEDIERLKAELHIADVDLNYTQYCPLNEVYISLYPQNVVLEAKPEMWYEVERRMESRGLEQLRNGVRMQALPQQQAMASRPKPKPAHKQDGSPEKSITVKAERVAAKPITPKGMSEDDFFRLNRREKRKAMRKGVKPLAAHAPAPNDIGEAAQDGNMSDGGFFEE